MNESDAHPDETTAAHLRRVLDGAADDIGDLDRARLAAARRRAVARVAEQPARRRQPLRWLVPAAFVAGLVLLVGRPESPQAPPTAAAPADVVRDLDLLTAEDSLDLYLDLEFYRWLPRGRSS